MPSKLFTHVKELMKRGAGNGKSEPAPAPEEEKKDKKDKKDKLVQTKTETAAKNVEKVGKRRSVLAFGGRKREKSPAPKGVAANAAAAGRGVNAAATMADTTAKKTADDNAPRALSEAVRVNEPETKPNEPVFKILPVPGPGESAPTAPNPELTASPLATPGPFIPSKGELDNLPVLSHEEAVKKTEELNQNEGSARSVA